MFTGDLYRFDMESHTWRYLILNWNEVSMCYLLVFCLKVVILCLKETSIVQSVSTIELSFLEEDVNLSPNTCGYSRLSFS